MAWNTLTYACGHTEQVQLYGKHAERDRTVAAAATHDCPACRAKAAAASDAAAGLPALAGSEKQVGWASECRAKLLPQLDAQAKRGADLLAKIDAGDLPAHITADKVDAARIEICKVMAAINSIRAESRAGYWINNRNNDVRVMINTAKGA